MKRILLICLLLVACSKQSSESPSGCDSSGSTFGDSEVNCRVSDVLFSNLEITQKPKEIILTAGKVQEVSFTIKNNGDESISGVSVANESGLSNIISNCDTLLKGQSCSAKMELYEEKVSSKSRSFKIKDSRIINNIVSFNYKTKATIPTKINKFKIETLDDKTKNIVVEEFLDKFDNLVLEKSLSISRLEKFSKFNAILNLESESSRVVEVYGNSSCNNLIGTIEDKQVNRLIEGRQRIFIKLKGSNKCIDTESFYDIDLTAPSVVSSEIEIVGSSASTDPNIHSSNTYPSIQFDPKDDIKEILLFGESSCSLPTGGISVTDFSSIINSLQLDVGNSKDFRVFAKAIDASGNISEQCVLVKHIVVDGEGPKLLIVKLLNENQEELVFPTNKLKPSFLDIEQTEDTAIIKLYKSIDCSGNTFQGLDNIATATRLFPLSSVPNFINGEAVLSMSAKSFDPVGNPSACVPVGTYVYDGDAPIINTFESTIDKEVDLATDKLKINGTLVSNINVVINEDINNMSYHFNKNNCSDSPDFSVQVPNGKDFDQEVIVPAGLSTICLSVNDIVSNKSCLCKDVLIDDKPGLITTEESLVILNASRREVSLPITLINPEASTYKLYRNGCNSEILTLSGDTNFNNIVINDSFLNGEDIVNIYYSSTDNFGNVKECSESELFFTVSNDLEAPSDISLGFFKIINEDEAIEQLRVKEFANLSRLVLGNQEEDIELVELYLDDKCESTKVIEFSKNEIASAKTGVLASTKLIDLPLHIEAVEENLFYGIIIDDSGNVNECHPVKNVFNPDRQLSVTLDNEAPILAIQVLNGDPPSDGEVTSLVSESSPSTYISNFINFSINPSLINNEEASVLTYLKGLYLVLKGESCLEKDLLIKNGVPIGDGSIDSRFVGKGMELRADLLDEAGNSRSCELITRYIHDNGNALDIPYQSKFGIIRSETLSNNILEVLSDNILRVADFDNNKKIISNRYNLKENYGISGLLSIVDIVSVYFENKLNNEKCIISGIDSIDSDKINEMIPYREDVTEIKGLDNCLDVAKDIYRTDNVVSIQNGSKNLFYISSDEKEFGLETIVTRINIDPSIVLNPIADSIKLVNVHYNNICIDIPDKVIIKEELGELELLLDNIPRPFGITTRTEVYIQLEDHFGNKGECELALDYTYKGEEFLLGNIPEILETVEYDNKEANKLGDRAGIFSGTYMTNGSSIKLTIADPSNDIQTVKYSENIDCSNPEMKENGDEYSLTGTNNSEYNVYGILVDNEGTESDCHNIFRIYNSDKKSIEPIALEFVEKGLQQNTIVVNINSIHQEIPNDISYVTNFVSEIRIYADNVCSRVIRSVEYKENGSFVNDEQFPILSYQPNFDNFYSFKIINRTGIEGDCVDDALSFYEDTLLGKIELINNTEFILVDEILSTKETDVVINSVLSLGGQSTLLADVAESVEFSLHYDSLCEGPIEFSNSVEGFYSKFNGAMSTGNLSFVLPVNKTTDLYAKVTDSFGNTSCDLVQSLRQDSINPLAPEGEISVTKGTSLSTSVNITHPEIEKTSFIEIFYEDGELTDPSLSCNNLITSIPKVLFNGSGLIFSINMSGRENSKITVWGRALDEVGNKSDCTLFGSYEHDSIIPVLSDITLTSVPSFDYRSDVLTPEITIDAKDGYTVRLYSDSLCSKKIHPNDSLAVGTHDIIFQNTGETHFTTKQFGSFQAKSIDLYGLISDSVNNTTGCIDINKKILVNSIGNNGTVTKLNYIGSKDITTEEKTVNILFEIGEEVNSIELFLEDTCTSSLGVKTKEELSSEVTFDILTRVVTRFYGKAQTTSGETNCQRVALINQISEDILPNLTPVGPFSVGLTDAVSIDFNDDGDDFDVDGDPIKYSCKVGDQANEPFVLSECTDKGIELNEDTGDFSWTPGSNAIGIFTVEISAEAFGATSKLIFNVTVLNDGLMFFTADDGLHGKELWVTNGEPDGTRMLKDINTRKRVNREGRRYQEIVSGSNSELNGCFDQINNCENNNDNCQFVNEVCLSEDLFLNSGSAPREFLEMDGLMYFSANDGIHGFELWVSDGTEKGTVLIKDINPGEASSNPSSLIKQFDPYNLFFSAKTFQHGQELWKSDGTPEGTVLMVNPLKNETGDIGGIVGRSSGIDKLYALNNEIYYASHSGSFGSELFISNGEPETNPQSNVLENSHLLHEGIQGSPSGHPTNMHEYKNFIYFSMTRDATPGTDREIHRIPTAEKTFFSGSSLFENISSKIDVNSNPEEFTTFDDRLYITANKDEDRTLLRTDGINDFALQFNDKKDLPNSNIAELKVCNDRLYFTASTNLTGRGLFYQSLANDNIRLIPGFPERPNLIDNTNFTEDFEENDSWQGSLGQFGLDNSVIISTESNVPSNGGANYFHQVIDTIPGVRYNVDYFIRDKSNPGVSISMSAQVLSADKRGGPFLGSIADTGVQLPGNFIFVATEYQTRIVLGAEVLQGNVTVSQVAVRALDISPLNKYCDRENDLLYFSGWDTAGKREPWVTDGTSGLTFRIANVNSKEDSDPNGFVTFRGKTYFAAKSDVSGRELWSTDGTKSNTVLFKDINIQSEQIEEIVNNAYSVNIASSGIINSENGKWIDSVSKNGDGRYFIKFKEGIFDSVPHIIGSVNGTDRRLFIDNISSNSLEIRTMFNPSEENSTGSNVLEDQPFTLIVSNNEFESDNIQTFKFTLANVSVDPVVIDNPFGVITSVVKIGNGRFKVFFKDDIFNRVPHVVASPKNNPNNKVRIFSTIKAEDSTVNSIEVRTYNEFNGNYDENASTYDHNFVLYIDKHIINNTDSSPGNFEILD
jgi:ELWxxDGT repeat protein